MLTKEDGFSLVELMVTLSIVSFSSLVVSSLIYIGGAYTMSLTEEFAAIESGYRLEYKLRKSLSLAIKVRPEGTARGANEIGHFNDIDCSNRISADCAENQWTEVAFYLGEGSTGGVGAPGETSLTHTYIWYKPPRHSATGVGSTTGVLSMPSLGYTNASASTPLLPTQNSYHIGQLSSFETETTTTGQGISKVKFSMSFRYHGVTKVKSWCSRFNLNPTTCTDCCTFNDGEVPSYSDYDKEFTVALVNNDLAPTMMDGSGLENRMLGPVHFFKPVYSIGR